MITKALKPKRKKDSPAPRKDVILEVARTLFNERGVNAVTTNHIAAEMGISPGNLYYHYRNKEDIILTLFERLVEEVEPILQVDADEELDATRLTGDIQAVLRVLMRYRFLFPEVMALTLSDERFAQSFRALQDRTVSRLITSFQRSYAAGPLLKQMPKPYMEALARNTWLLLVNWVNYVESTRDGTAPISEDDLAYGVFHIFAMLRPYMNRAAINDIEAMFPIIPRFSDETPLTES